MAMRCIEFAYIPARINVMPADPKLNVLFRAASMTYLQPFALAVELGRLTEATALKNLAMAYGEGVIAGSPDEELMDFTPRDWTKWLLDHPEEFEQLKGICEVSSNFVDEGPANGNPA